MARSWIPAFAGMTVVLLAAGCGYSLAGRGVYLPSHLRKVTVPLLANDTYEYQLASNLTFELVEQLTSHRELSVVPLDQADAVLEGKVLSYGLEPVRVDTAGVAQTYRITIRAELRFRDLVQKRVHWENSSYAFSLDYEVPGDLSTREQTEVEAQREVVRGMAQNVVEQILEGF